jgi:hypothetical protein
MAEGPPANYPSADYSFYLQAIMELQKSMGQLTEAVSGIRSDIKDHGEKLDRFEKILYAASAIGLGLVVVGGFLINKLWDPVVAALQKIAKLP